MSNGNQEHPLQQDIQFVPAVTNDGQEDGDHRVSSPDAGFVPMIGSFRKMIGTFGKRDATSNSGENGSDLATASPMEIHFQPTGDTVLATTTEVPKQGSFVGQEPEDGTSPRPPPTDWKEVHFSPSVGRDMETTGVPAQGSFAMKRKQPLEASPPSASETQPVMGDGLPNFEVRLDDPELETSKRANIMGPQDDAQQPQNPTQKLADIEKVDPQPTPKISNRSSLHSLGETTLSAIHEGGLPLQPDLETQPGSRRERQSDDSRDRGHDFSTVPPTQKTRSILPIEEEMLSEMEHPNQQVQEGDQESCTSSYVGDVDERHQTSQDIEFRPEGFLPVPGAQEPKQGGYRDKSSSVHTEVTSSMSISVMSSSEREIHFSPGASEMKEVAVPKHGSFLGDNNYDDIALPIITPTKTKTSPSEINFSPGASDIKEVANPMKGSFRGNKGDEPTPNITSPKTSPSMEREINFSPGGSDMPDVVVPKQGSFHGNKDDETTPRIAPTKTSPATGREINFSPGGSDMTGVAIPNQGSFVGKKTLDAKREDAGLSDLSILEMEAMLDQALENELLGSELPIADSETASAVSDEVLSESCIPGESFLKMGAMLQSQHREDFNETGVENQLDSMLDDDMILAGKEDLVENAKTTEMNDEHDDLLDSMLGDEVKEDMAENVKTTEMKDEHDDLLDSMLGDDDIENLRENTTERYNDSIDRDPEDAMIASILDDDGEAKIESNPSDLPFMDDGSAEYIPDESIRKLEALLDQGLRNNGHMVEKKGCINDLEIYPKDSMARELDELLGSHDMEEEVEFDFDATKAPSKKENSAGAGGKGITPSQQPVDAKKKGPIKKGISKVGNIFRQRKPVDDQSKKTQKIKSEKTQKDVDKKQRRPLFASRTASRSLGTNRKMTPSKEKTKTTPQKQNVHKTRPKATGDKVKTNKSPVVATPEMNSIKTKRRYLSGSALGHFMSPTVASVRRYGSAPEDAPPPPKEFNHPHPSLRTWSSGKKSFMASTFSSIKKFGGKPTSAEEDECREHKMHGDKINPDGTKTRTTGAFMAPTFSRTMQERETEIMVAQKALEKEEEAAKMIVNKISSREKQKPRPLLDHSVELAADHIASTVPYTPQSKIHTPTRFHDEASPAASTPKGRLEWTPRGGVAEDSEDLSGMEVTPLNHSPKSVYTHRSAGSLSSQCSIQSFVSPYKAGRKGCLSLFNPYLHKTNGPCELCVFRLSDAEKIQLDTKGRHILVQFTTGGCPDCQVFPTSFDEPPVRLCPKCYSSCHRANPTKLRRCRKLGNDAARIGYSFAKVEYS